MAVIEKFRDIIYAIVQGNEGDGISGIDAGRQFNFNEKRGNKSVQSLNAAFLIKLAGEKHPDFKKADDYIKTLSGKPEWSGMTAFYSDAVDSIYKEIYDCYENDEHFRHDLDNLHVWLKTSSNLSDSEAAAEKIRGLFFPEGSIDTDDLEKEITGLRNKRKVTITGLNQNPVTRPESEIIFTSNVLLTVPPGSTNIDELDIKESIKDKLKKTVLEKQLYWYDHPIRIGTAPANNEVIYGLEKLDEAIIFEESKGIKDSDAKVDCVLSVSVTHKGLQDISKDYIENELTCNCNISRLNLYVFTEKETESIIENVLKPAAGRYMGNPDTGFLHVIFGVDGEYGRHYSFLKAIAALWNVLISPEIKGAFKIDLDQVFHQEKLLEETGYTAFQHLQSKLWGANGRDSLGNRVHLGLIAGALVNESDIESSIFTPDVSFPGNDTKGDTLIFNSIVPQALSTIAEMQTRYGTESGIDGIDSCIQRIHVTGGTNGILINSLRKYRPFTPSVIGRAEDQAYIMSALFRDEEHGYLRYAHRDGLIMRHDKASFASEAIHNARMGKIVGDYIRIILFSQYAGSLPWSIDRIKETVDPFTGCFISRIPWTVVLLRMSLKAAAFFNGDDEAEDGEELLNLGAGRLANLKKSLSSGDNSFADIYQKEKDGWESYYDILDKLEEKLSEGDSFASDIRDRARLIVECCKLNVSNR